MVSDIGLAMPFRNKNISPYVYLFFLGVATLATASVPYARADGVFFAETPKLGIGISYKFEEEKRGIPGTETETTGYDILEKVTIETNGWVYHPNLMEYHLSFEPEWRQETFRQSQSTGDPIPDHRSDTSVLSYDATTTLFRQKPYSLDIFANRDTRQIDLSYHEDTDIESETWGTRLRFVSPLLHASIGLINRQSAQTGFYRSDEDYQEVQLKVRHNIKRSVTELNILRNDTDRTIGTTSETIGIASNTTNSEITNTYFFTSNERVRLDSQLYLRQAEYDDVRIDTRIASANLFWTHSKNLLTRYTLNLNRREVDDFGTEGKAFSALLTHHLGDALTSSLGAEASFNDFPGGSEDRYRSDMGVLYRRPIPWGSIELGASYDYGLTKRKGNQDIIPTEARYVLSTLVETFLNRENIIAGSIVVTDRTGTIAYTENIDYRIEQMGSDVRIRRTLMGAIGDGQQVTVHYNYHRDTGYDDSRLGQDYRFGLKLWSFLHLTYTHGRINQGIQSGKAPSDLQDDTYHTVRIRLDTKWSETQFLHDKQDRSNGSASVTSSVRQLVNLSLARNFFLNFSGDIGNRDFPDTNEEEKFYSLGTTIGWSPKWWCNFSLIYLWDQISGDRQDMLYSEIAPTVKLAYGVWTGIASYRLRDQEDRQTGNSLWRQEVFFTVNRRLW